MPFEKLNCGLRRFFSSGWMVLLAPAVVWWVAKLGGFSISTYQSITAGVLLVTLLLAVFWVVTDRKKIAIEPAIFIGSIAVIFGFFGPELEFPQDNWFYWQRANAFFEGLATTPMGISINGSILAQLPKDIWITDVWIIATAWAVLVIYLMWRFANTVGIEGVWGRIAAISVLFTMGTLGLHSFRHVILGHAAMGIAVQIALFTEVILALNQQKFRRLWLVLPLFLIIGGNHLQNIVMSILGLVAIALWFVVSRFGWLRGGCSLAAVALIFWGVFDVFLFPEAREIRVDELITEGIWLREPGIFNLFGAEKRALLPLGIIGILNLVVAVWLVARNHVIGWLTLMPVLALSYPPFAKIYATALEQTGNLIVFNRLFFIVPTTFAIFLALQHFQKWLSQKSSSPKWLNNFLPGTLGFATLFLAFIPHEPFYGKITHWLNNPPADLRQTKSRELVDWVRKNKHIDKGDLILSDVTTRYVLSSEFPSYSLETGRWLAGRLSDVATDPADAITNAKAVVLVAKPLPVSSRPSLMSRIFSHSDPLLVKRNLTFSPEWMNRMNGLVNTQGWTREEVPPFYVWFEPPKSSNEQ